MSSKPTVVPLWAATGPITTPSGGKQAAGWTPQERGAAQYFNWLQHHAGLWFQYLYDGDVDFTGLRLANTDKAIANGANTDLNITGGGSLTGISHVSLTGGGASATMSGIVNGTDGRVLVLFNNTGSKISMLNLTASGASNQIVNPGLGGTLVVPAYGVVALRYDAALGAALNGGAGVWVVAWTSFAGLGAVIQGETVGYTTPIEEIVATFTSGESGGAAHTRSVSQWIFAASTNPVYYPLPVKVGDVITQWKTDLAKNTNGAATFRGEIVFEDSGGETSVGASVTTDNSNAPGHIIFGVSGLSITVSAGEQYYLKFTPSGSITTAADRIYTTSFYRKRP